MSEVGCEQKQEIGRSAALAEWQNLNGVTPGQGLLRRSETSYD